MVNLTLKIDVLYEPNGVPTYELERLLIGAALHIAGNGLLSGESDAQVISWDYNVEINV